jgi:hypothetical protein
MEAYHEANSDDDDDSTLTIGETEDV